MIQREYEVQQMVQLMQTVSPESPIYPILLTNVIESMTLANREQLIGQLEAAAQPSEEEMAAAEEARQAELAFKDAQTQYLAAQAMEAAAHGEKYRMEVEEEPKQTALEFERIEMEKARAAAQNMIEGTNDDGEFERRMRVLSALQDERRIALEEKNAASNAASQAHAADMSARKAQAEQAMGQQMQPPGPPPGVGI